MTNDVSRETRLRNQIRIHWKWLKNKSEKEVSDFIVNIANAEVGDELKWKRKRKFIEE